MTLLRVLYGILLFSPMQEKFLQLPDIQVMLDLARGIENTSHPLNDNLPGRKALHVYDWVEEESIALLVSEWIFSSHT